VTGRQVQIDPVPEHRRVPLVPDRGLLPDHPIVDAGQHRAAPQLEGLPQQFAGIVGTARRAGRGYQPGELLGVQAGVADADPVPGRVGDDHARRQRPAQPGDAGLQLPSGRDRRPVLPDRVDQLVDAHDPAWSQEQHREHHAVTTCRYRDLAARVGHGQRSQDAESHHRVNRFPPRRQST
jgi:hypothetical protein